MKTHWTQPVTLAIRDTRDVNIVRAFALAVTFGAFILLSLGNSGCSGVDADWPMEDAGPSADVSQPDTTSPPPDNGDPGGCDFENPVMDCDGDGRVGSADCDPYNDDSYQGAPELCDNVDNDCDGQKDEGCTTTPPPTGGGSTCVDSDGDGYCAATGPLDCNDQNNKVKPGVAEDCSTSYDDNCNGQANEGCGSGTTPPPTNGAALTIVVNYPFAVARKLSAQVAKTSGQLGGWWDKEVPGTGTSLTLDLSSVPEEACWLRLNVAQDNVKWLCMGNGSTATLDPDAGVGISFKGKNYTKSDLMVWSAPGGTAAGCSALLKLKPDCSL